ncbi:MAG: phosphoribosylaminoimidazolesuccinocarboxamide synthase [Xanthomonadales bacterium]|nr:phosphoribosylaminoimidazolesuccinocarboxamide synthase [Xanthomonadales bacterium]
MENSAYKTEWISSLPLLYQGKVRDVFEIDAERLLIIASDRLSAYDVVLPEPIPGKGEILTRISNFWFNYTAALMPNHCLEGNLSEVLGDSELAARLEGRAVIVRRMKPLPVEAIVRGYIIGSGWKDYQQTGQVSGVRLPAGLQLAEKLPEPVFTPSTKAAAGDHDMNISFAEMENRIGAELAQQVRDASLNIYTRAAEFARSRGIIIADTKFEFGLDNNGKLRIIDEMLTPDSSRFWSLKDYRAGISPPSYDKQFIRDYLETLDWDKTAPGPKVPAEIIQATTAKYQQAWQHLVGET